MPIQLDKILTDISEEQALHPYSANANTKKDQDDAWARVGKKNKLSGHEAKSIFKVLQKKYEQEKLKRASTWKLYQQMKEICQEKGSKTKEENDVDDESFVEFLEVRDEYDDEEAENGYEEKTTKSTTNPAAESLEKDSSTNIDIKPEQKLLNTQMMIPQSTAPIKPDFTTSTTRSNTTASNPNTPQQNKQQVSAAVSNALQKKGISMRKATPPALKPVAVVPNQTVKTETPQQKSLIGSENPRSITLSEGLKRKFQSIERREESSAKRSNINSTTNSNAPQQQANSIATQIPSVTIKQEVFDEMETSTMSETPISAPPISVITIPSSTVGGDQPNGTITTIKSNGFTATRIEDIDFQKDIIFDSSTSASKQPLNESQDIINIGNFENHLPPTFFKNLCNSQRHEALGLYVANVMNRVTGKTALKLELNILKAIVEAQSDELAKL